MPALTRRGQFSHAHRLIVTTHHLPDIRIGGTIVPPPRPGAGKGGNEMYMYSQQADYSGLVAIIVIASVIDLIILYLIIRTAVKEGINRSVLGKPRVDAAASPDVGVKAVPDDEESALDSGGKDDSGAIKSPWA